ncbi:hypothetical protein M409DRAFT_58600 [Zasmidium cellare ATCC 36951]|uniref:Uncharacterized protein n=1 Tax=Zasmidium cellare ATCC 36951 TaxID=1080233 RepID=A0A6A6C5G7_ZASCE|nr:uncharacterized protein M409DRAFT_58600 [Zasmidium cellare ATCC 36951]KAF2162163.1 hypothetical protein M409DRAFT_58600 [Zasmidium cellare ATCC 36951]
MSSENGCGDLQKRPGWRLYGAERRPEEISNDRPWQAWSPPRVATRDTKLHEVRVVGAVMVSHGKCPSSPPSPERKKRCQRVTDERKAKPKHSTHSAATNGHDGAPQDAYELECWSCGADEAAMPWAGIVALGDG